MHDIMKSYLLIVCVTLVLTMIISWFLSDMLTRPLKSLVSAAKKFGHGEFDVRVSENNNCDEIDELAVSFNNMATSLQQQEELSRGFVANVSHELKTPMTSIRGFVDGMLDGTIPPGKAHAVLKDYLGGSRQTVASGHTHAGCCEDSGGRAYHHTGAVRPD